MKKIAGMMLAAGALSFGGCAVDAGDQGQMSELDQKEQNWWWGGGFTGGDCSASPVDPMAPQGGLCGDPKFKFAATLAVAVAKETGRMNPLDDFKIGYVQQRWWAQQQLVLTDSAKNACASRGFGDCENTQSILALQNADINDEGVSRSVIDAQQFANFLTSKWNDMKMAKDQRWACYFPTNTGMQLISSSDLNAICSGGVHYEFAITGTAVEDFRFNLQAFGYRDGNPYLDLRTFENSVAIDPDANMTGDSTASSGSCVDSCLIYGHEYSGDCCSCNGQQGSYQKVRRANYACK
jgi:hypothetical protein